MSRVGEVRRKQQRGIRTRLALLEAAGRVFARMEYDKAKLKDISDDAGISLGSLYFHFGNKDDVAAAVLDVQQERMTEVLSSVVEETEGTSLERLLDLLEGMAELIAGDALVQAGIRLLTSLPDELKDRGYGYYDEWQRVTATLVGEGVEDGSVTSGIPSHELAEVVNETFVGAQVLSGMLDGWQTLPGRVRRARPRLEQLLAP